jgi:hypothetical protein
MKTVISTEATDSITVRRAVEITVFVVAVVVLVTLLSFRTLSVVERGRNLCITSDNQTDHLLVSYSGLLTKTAIPDATSLSPTKIA